MRAIPIVTLVVALDFAYQWYKTREQMMMTFQEVKDEMKQAEGDPIFKGMRRQRQREIAMMRTLQEVPKADVVVANPTHFAVAIRYRKAEADAPVVIAKGVDHLALKICEVAEENDVAVVENPPLARALHKQTKEGQQIPQITMLQWQKCLQPSTKKGDNGVGSQPMCNVNIVLWLMIW